MLDQPLADIGGKGLFIKELEVAMDEGRADLAVHSLKDVPMDMPAGLRACGDHGARGSARCARVESTIARSPSCAGGVVGTSSLRREAQLRERYPQLARRAAARQRQYAPAQARRGPVRRDHPRRRGAEAPRLRARIASLLDPEESLPAPGQGALALECRTDRDDVMAALAPLADSARRSRPPRSAHSRARCAGSCHTPLAAYAMAATSSCGCAGLSRAATAATSCAASVRSGRRPTSEAAEALGAALGGRFPRARRRRAAG